MKIKRWFILAGGSATRWEGYLGKKNKCYIEIDGESLVDRAIRLLEENGQHNYEVVLEGYDSKRRAFEGVARKAQEPFGILLGDERFDENLNVAEDIDWLRRVIKEGMNRYESASAIYVTTGTLILTHYPNALIVGIYRTRNLTFKNNRGIWEL